MMKGRRERGRKEGKKKLSQTMDDNETYTQVESLRSPIHFGTFFPHKSVSCRSWINLLFLLGPLAAASKKAQGRWAAQQHSSQKGSRREENSSALTRGPRPPPGTGCSSQHRMPIHNTHQGPPVSLATIGSPRQNVRAGRKADGKPRCQGN